MIDGFNNINNLVVKETMRAIRETLGGFMNEDGADSERRRQEKQASAVLDRGLKKGMTAEVEEADEEETGVPEDVDAEDEKREDRTGGKGTKDSNKLKTPSKRKIRRVTVGSVIDKLNVMRGGRSLKDNEVKTSFKQYFDSLTQAERQSLLVFLTGIAQILAGTESGSEALDPGDVGLRVKGKVSDKKKSASASGSAKNSSDSAAPIVVGESINSRTTRALREYKKYSSLK